MHKYLFFFALVIMFSASIVPAFAQKGGPYFPPTPNLPGGPLPGQTGPKGGCALDEVQIDLGCFPNNPAKFVQKFYGVGLGFVGSASLLALIGGGYLLMTSKGDQRLLNVGKSYIYYAISGLLLAIFGYVIIRVIVTDVLRIPGFN